MRHNAEVVLVTKAMLAVSHNVRGRAVHPRVWWRVNVRSGAENSQRRVVHRCLSKMPPSFVLSLWVVLVWKMRGCIMDHDWSVVQLCEGGASMLANPASSSDHAVASLLSLSKSLLHRVADEPLYVASNQWLITTDAHCFPAFAFLGILDDVMAFLVCALFNNLSGLVMQ